MVDSMSATSSFLRRPSAGTTTASMPVMATPRRRPVERDVAGDVGRQPVGRADRGAAGRAGPRRQHRIAPSFERRMGGARDQDEDVLHAPPLAAGTVDLQTIRPPWPSSASSSSPDRPPAASRRWRSRSPEAHGGTVINADAMQTYDAFPILTAQPTAEERARRAASALRRAAAQRDPVGRALARRWRRPRSSAAGRGPHAHPVRRLGPLSPDLDAGHCRHSRSSPPSVRDQANARLAGDGRRRLPRPACRAAIRRSWRG